MNKATASARLVLMISIAVLALVGVLGWMLPAIGVVPESEAAGPALSGLPSWVPICGVALILIAALLVARSGRRALKLAEASYTDDPEVVSQWTSAKRSADSPPDVTAGGSGPGAEHGVSLARRLREEVSRSNRHRHDLSVLSISIDSTPEMESAPSGQIPRLLATVGEIVQNSIRVSDAYGRIGPNSLLVILAETETKGAERVAEKLRRNVEVYPFDRSFPITVSIGVAGEDGEKLTERADSAREASGHAGGNRVTTSGSETTAHS